MSTFNANCIPLCNIGTFPVLYLALRSCLSRGKRTSTFTFDRADADDVISFISGMSYGHIRYFANRIELPRIELLTKL